MLALVALAGCGGSKKTTASSTTEAPPTTIGSTSTTAAPTPTTAAAAKQTLTITPSTGLADGQTVHLVASGFHSNENLGVTQCAAKGAQTGMGDCDVNGIKPITADAAGTVTTDFVVKKGPFGSNKVICGPSQPCLVSVTQLTISPTEEADAPISFG